MEEKKVHWKTAQKLAKETVDLTDGIEQVDAASATIIPDGRIEELKKVDVITASNDLKEVLKQKVSTSRPYHVYDARANIVAYAEDEETADIELAKFPGGTKKMI